MPDYRINVIVDSKQAGTGVAQTQRQLGTLEQTATRLRQTFARVFAGLAAGFAVGNLVSTVSRFEQAMSTVQAVTAATADQFERLNGEARRLGETTRFSATEAANAMTFLARAGFDTGEILASIEGTLKLAQAGAIGLAEAADISSNVLTGFRLEVEEIGRVVDVMALATNRSNQNIQQLGDAMKFVGPVASGVAADFEEIVASLGALADAGLQGSLGGTGLRRVISELESPAQKTLEIFHALGVQMEEIRPSVVGVVSAIERLADAGVDTGLALEVFGDRGGPAFEVLSNSIPKIREMTAALKEAEGTATDMARVMDDNLNGAMKAVASAAESVVLAFGELGASGMLNATFRGVADALRFVAANMEESASVAAAFIGALALPRLAAIAAAIGGITAATGALTTALGIAAGAARLLGRALLVGLAIEGVQLAISNWDAIIDRLERVGGAADKAYQSYRQLAVPALGALIGDAEAAADAFSYLENTVSTFFTLIQRDIVSPLFDLLTGDFDGFVAGMERLINQFVTLYQQIGNFEFPVLDLSTFEIAAGIIDGVTAAIRALIESVSGDFVGRAIDSLNGLFASANRLFGGSEAGGAQVGGNTFGGATFGGNVFGGLQDALEGLNADAFGDLYDGFEELEQRADAAGSNIMQALVRGFETAAADTRGLDQIGVQVASVGDSFQFLATQIEPAVDALQGLDASAFGDLYEGVDLTAAAYEGLNEAVVAGTASFAQATGSVTNIADRYKEFADEVESLRGSFDPIGSATRELVEHQETLTLALQTGQIEAAEYHRIMGNLTEEYRSQINPLATLREEYQKNIDLLSIPIDQRSISHQVDSDVLRLQREGITLTGEQTDALRDLIQASNDAADAGFRQQRLYDEIQDPLREYTLQTEALQDVLRHHPELANRAAEAQERLRLTYLDQQTDPLSGLERGAIRVAQQFNDAATLVEGAFTRAFKSAEDALVQFVTTGELSFKNLVDGIVADLARIVIRDTITGPIANAIKAAISGGGGGGEGGGIFGDFLGKLGGIFKQEGSAGGWLTGLGTVFTTVGNSFLEVLAGVFQGGAGLFGKLFEGLGGLFGGGGGGFLGSLGGILGKAIDGISSIFGGGGDGFLGKIGGIFSGAVDSIGSIFGLGGSGGGFLSGLTSLFSGGGAAGGFLSSLGSLAASAGPWGLFAGGLAALFSGGAAGQWLGSLGGLFSKGISVVGDAIGSVVSGAVDVGSKVVSGVVNTAKKVVGGVGNAVKKIFGGLFATGGPVLPAYAPGGVIQGPGTGTSDSIVTALPVGSYIINAEATRRHRELLDRISGAPRFNNGGGAILARVSNGEYFVPPGVAEKNRGLLDAINYGGLPGYQAGGVISSLSSSVANVAAQVTQTAGSIDQTLVSVFNGVAAVVQAAIDTVQAAINAANTVATEFENASSSPDLNFASGGSVMARVSRGEYFVPPGAASRNRPLLDAINSGAPRFQNGGLVGGAVAPAPQIIINDQRSANAPAVEVSTSTSNGQQRTEITVRDIDDAIESGGVDDALGRRYGLRPLL